MFTYGNGNIGVVMGHTVLEVAGEFKLVKWSYTAHYFNTIPVRHLNF